MSTQQEFQEWLVRRGNPGAAMSYPAAINMISEHYSGATGTNTDIYAITDQFRISEIAHDYRQAGRFSEFGYRQHARFRAAIIRYAEFFSQPRGHDASPEPAPVPEPETDDADVIPRRNFAYERDLQTTLCAQVAELFPGYRIFGNDLLGVEYGIGDRRIDVLLEHEQNGELLALELKSGLADYRVFGQIGMYMGLLQAAFPGIEVSGVIVAGAIDPSLIQACATTNRVTLKVYRMSLELDDA
jgi:hypothetical protein